MSLVPDASSMRTHDLFQSSSLLNLVLDRTPISIDVSLFLPHTPNLCPVPYRWKGHQLLRLPYFWEDDSEMEEASPSWHFSSSLSLGEGLKIFDFHPVHVYLNSPSMERYEALKTKFPSLRGVRPTTISQFTYNGNGTQTLFLELVEHLSLDNQSVFIRDLNL